jgi:hypothetical protein
MASVDAAAAGPGSGQEQQPDGPAGPVDGQEEPPDCRCGDPSQFTFAKTRARESGRQIFRAEAVESEEEKLQSNWDAFSSKTKAPELLQKKLQIG